MVLEVGAPSQQAAVQLTLSLTLTPTLSPNPSPGSPRRGHLLRSQARVLDRLFRVRVRVRVRVRARDRARVRVRISDSVRVRVVVSCPACCMAMYAYLALRPMNRACLRSMKSSQLMSGVPQMCDFMPGCRGTNLPTPARHCAALPRPARVRHAYSVRGPGGTLPCASGAYAGSRVAGTRTAPPFLSCQHSGHADLLVLFAELDAGLGLVERVRHLVLRIAQARHNAHAGHDDSSVALPRTQPRHATGRVAGSSLLGRTICSCVVLRAAWPASRAIGADGETSMPTTLDEASSSATMWVRRGSGRSVIRRSFDKVHSRGGRQRKDENYP